MAKKTTEKNTIELYFEWWLLEMQSKGFVKEFFREPETMLVQAPAEYGRYKRFKTKEKEVETFNLFPRIQYTYDYIVVWNKSAEYLFYEEVNDKRESIFQFSMPQFIAHEDKEGDIVSYVDVKPTNAVQQRGGKVSSAITFPLKQRMLWDRHRLFINKVVPIPMAGTGYNSALFIKTFTPQRYLLTDGGGQRRKIKFKTESLVEFVNKKTTYMNNLLKNTK
jgi:hypothetical protein